MTTPPATISPPPETGARAEERVPIWRSIVVLAVAGVVCLFFWIKPQPTLHSQSGVVMKMPDYVRSGPGFFGTEAPVSEAEKLILPKDTEFARKDYRDYPGHDDIFCGIVLSGAQQQSIHRPEVCLVAQGWTISEQENVPIKLESGRTLTVRNLTIRRTIPVEGKQVTLTRYNMYWFVGDGVTTPSHFTRVFLSIWDRVVHNRAHRWAYVTVAAYITKDLQADGKDAAETKAMLTDFIKHAVPSFQKDEMPASSAQN